MCYQGVRQTPSFRFVGYKKKNGDLIPGLPSNGSTFLLLDFYSNIEIWRTIIRGEYYNEWEYSTGKDWTNELKKHDIVAIDDKLEHLWGAIFYYSGKEFDKHHITPKDGGSPYPACQSVATFPLGPVLRLRGICRSTAFNFEFTCIMKDNGYFK